MSRGAGRTVPMWASSPLVDVERRVRQPRSPQHTILVALPWRIGEKRDVVYFLSTTGPASAAALRVTLVAFANC